MRLLTAWVFMVAAGFSATLRLRYGGSDSAYRITAISNASPAVVSVVDINSVARHSLVAGDTIYLHSGQGCRQIWGYKKVAASPVPTASTFAVTQLDGTPVRCTTVFDNTTLAGSGWVGKYKTVTTYTSFPRMMSPQSGPIKDRMIDQRSTGGSIARMVTENGAAYQKLLAGVSGLVSSGARCFATVPPVDGTGDSVCAAEKASLAKGLIADGAGIFGIAELWQADKTKTNYLQAVRYYLWNLPRSIYAYGRNFGWAVDQTAAHGGLSSSTDWLAGYLVEVAKAYDIVHNQLTPTEKSRFADLILNGYDGNAKTCTSQVIKQTGTVSTVPGDPPKSGTVTGTGTAFTTQFAVGDYLLFKNGTINGVAQKWGAMGTWAKVLTIASDTSMTVQGAANTATIPKATNADLYKVVQWDQAQHHCGALYATGVHGYYVGDVSNVGITTLVNSIPNATTTRITVATSANFLDPVPYNIVIDDEMMTVTADAPSGGHNVLTVTRGVDYSTGAAHLITSSPIPVIWQMTRRASISSTGGPYFAGGNWMNNLENQRLVGYLAAGIALCDDDPRAVALFERAFNWFYDTTFPHMEEAWTGLTDGGFTNFGYQWGRWQANIMTIVLNAQFAFSNATYPELIGDYLWRGVGLAYWWSQPGSAFTQGPNSPWMPEAQYEAREKNGTAMSWFMLAAMFHPGAEADYATYWYRNFSMFRAAMGPRMAMWVAPYFVDSAATNPGLNFTTRIKPWMFYADSTYGRANSTLISRSDWTSSASMLITQPYWIRGDHNEMTVSNYPGAMFLHKGSKLLIGGNGSTMTGAGSGANASWMRLGSQLSRHTKLEGIPWFSQGGSAEIMTHFDRQIGTDTYVYARSLLVHAWDAPINATRSTRTFIHWKVGGDYVITFDDHATGFSNYFDADWWYPYSDDIPYVRGQAGTFGARSRCPAPVVPTFTYDAVNRIVVFKKPDTTCNPIGGIRKTNGTLPPVIPAMVTSEIFFPDGASPTIATSTGSYAYNVHIAWSARPAAQMITVHRVARGTSDSFPAISIVKSDASSYGLQIDNGDNCLVIVYANDGADRYVRTVTTTYRGNGQALITGLAPGDYLTSIDGGRRSASRTVLTDGTLLISANGAHTFAVSNTGK